MGSVRVGRWERGRKVCFKLQRLRYAEGVQVDLIEPLFGCCHTLLMQLMFAQVLLGCGKCVCLNGV